MKIFISYSHDDSTFVDQLANDLSAEYSVLIDSRSIIPDVPLVVQIWSFIEMSNYFLRIVSARSIRSGWVDREFAIMFPRAMEQKISIVPLIMGRIKPSSLISHMPYVRFSRPAHPPEYMKSLQQLLQFLRRSPVVSGNLVLPRFEPWGNLTVAPYDQFGARLRNSSRGASGLLYDGPIRIRGCSRLILSVSGSAKSDFSGWSAELPKMLKLQANDQPLSPTDPALAVKDDPGWIKPIDGTTEYLFSKEICDKGFIGKLEFVLGSGTIDGLEVKASIA